MSGKFFEFSQNNSGGHFHVDDDLTHRVYIEADSADEANQKIQDLGAYFDGCETGNDCECCGDRWYPAWSDEGRTFPYEYDAKKGLIFSSVEEYAQYLADEFGWTDPDCYIHYKKGAKVTIRSVKAVAKKNRGKKL
jgi:hypothetical protein